MRAYVGKPIQYVSQRYHQLSFFFFFFFFFIYLFLSFVVLFVLFVCLFCLFDSYLFLSERLISFFLFVACVPHHLLIFSFGYLFACLFAFLHVHVFCLFFAWASFSSHFSFCSSPPTQHDMWTLCSNFCCLFSFDCGVRVRAISSSVLLPTMMPEQVDLFQAACGCNLSTCIKP